MDTPRHIRIFLSSPGDVGDERTLALQVIEQLGYDTGLEDKVTFKVVAWDKPGAGIPMLATMTPQAAIDAGLPKPSECDIVIVIFWGRMGTPLPSQYKKADGSPYLSGTEWEFEDAMRAARQHKRPQVVVYRRTEKVLLDPDAADFQAKLEQKQRVNEFFATFTEPETGAILQGINPYEKPADFRRDFERHLRVLVDRLLKTPLADNVSLPKDPIPKREIWQGSPFPGLRAFTPDDAPIFFGRGQKIDSLIEFVRENRVTAVVGASGSGKSSLVGAGLIPRLMSNAIEGSKDWLWLRFTPGEISDNPFTALAAKLETFLTRTNWNTRKLSDALSQNPASIHEIIGQILADKLAWVELLFFVDQFEELFTLAHEQYRPAFIELLTQIANSSRVRAVLTMRSDFYQHCVAYPGLEELLTHSTFPLSIPRTFSLLEMIKRPAERAALVFDDGLPEQIVTDTGNNPGALALMAYTLDELYQLRGTEGKLTYNHYKSLGGVQGAIGTRAENTFNTLDAAAQAALPRVFECLLAVDENGTATRERALLSTFDNDPAGSRLINAFIDARLLTTTDNAENTDNKTPMVEVAHEALFRSWERLTNWITEIRDDLMLLRQVRQAAKQWYDHHSDPFFLWPDERLKPVYAMLERLKPQLTKMDEDFIRPEAERILQNTHTYPSDTTHQTLSAWGDRLSVIGDPRPGVGLKPNDIPDMSWCFVPEGKVNLEDGAGEFNVAPFFMAQYPVTYRQYKAFLDDPQGFKHDDWWKGLASVKQPMLEQTTRYWSYPRDNISWYQAVAFGRWLSDCLKGEKIESADGFSCTIGVDCVIRLPTEWEWQQAATGGDWKRTYPWGKWKPMQANTKESGLNRTIAVGMYPDGASPVGVLDMCGNVFEWCLNQYEDTGITDLAGEANRVLRGGSFFNDPPECTTGYRSLAIPDLREFTFGFRVCAASTL